MINTGITFGNLHSYTNLNLILSECNIPPAQPKTTYIDVPGLDGDLDLSEALGDVKFNDRECEFVFTVSPTCTDTFETVKTTVSNALNGKLLNITLDKDSSYYYRGRITVNEYLQDKAIKQIVINAKVKPYKYKQNVTETTFNLSSTARNVTLTNGRLPAIPTITTSANNAQIVFNGTTHTMSAGTHQFLDVKLVQGNNTINIKGSGTIKFSYQEGEL